MNNDRQFTGVLNEDIVDNAIPSFCLYYHDTAYFSSCASRLRDQYMQVVTRQGTK